MHRVLNAINGQKYCRKSPPKDTLKLWKCLETIKYSKNRRSYQKEIFAKNMSEFESEKQVKTLIDNSLDDKLVVEDIHKTKGYRLIPFLNRNELLSQTTNDWYCFECHSSGPELNLIGCKSCFRSFHEKCLHSNEEPINGSDQQLNQKSKDKSLIKSIKGSNVKSSEQLATGSLNPSSRESTVKSKELLDTNCVQQSDIGSNSVNEFRSFLSDSNDMDFECRYCLQFKCPDTKIRVKQICGEELNLLIELFWKTIENEFFAEEINIYTEYAIDSALISYILLFYHLDLDIIGQKVYYIQNYTSFVEFENDLRHFFHNFIVVNDKDLIQPLIKRIENEFEILFRCMDCYLWERAPKELRVPIEEWFLHVCNPSHRLVYAKLKGYSYWPSKVIRWDQQSQECEVQFFELRPQKFRTAVVPINMTKDIDYKLDSKRFQDVIFVESIAHLFKYLKNLCNEEKDVKYGSVFQYLKGSLTRIWNKHKYEFLADLNLEVKTSGKKPTIKSMTGGFKSAKDSQQMNAYKHMICSERKIYSQPKDDDPIDKASVVSQESNDSVEGEKTALQKLLNDHEIPSEAKMKICDLIIRFFTDKESQK